ncbi:hypothetical protein CYMTET_19112 [Cymbomonas tetramitiformis]|uniref:Reverse transcriptase Ty1/copia-type domain-containing protein n=1 Tax=Cymbomonas tetramitiformis TaxID=36881 RepID=A0AAE0G6N2_9CHLO|nr:hypothetical protein CYMTET_19112 [Cymbomonas tetramitiformis]
MKGDGLDSKSFPPLPRKPDPHGKDLPSPDPPRSQEDLLKAILCLQQQQEEDQCLFREQLQRQAAINESLEAQIAVTSAKSGTADPNNATKTAEQLLERRRKLAYVPEADVNPSPRRPKTLPSRMPQLYDLHGNKTYDTLAKKSNSSMKYELLVSGPALSYLHNAVTFGNDSLDSVDGNETLDSLHQRFHEVINSVQGVYSMLCNRWTMLELRAQLELDPSSSHRGGAEALRAKLQFVEHRVYQAADGVVADEVLQQWLNNFDKSRGKAMLNTKAKQTANAEAGTSSRWRHRDDKNKHDKDKHNDKHNDRKPSGGKGKGGRGGKPAADNSEVMQWITEGCKLRWKTGPPPAFNHGVSLRDALLQQQQWVDAENHRLLVIEHLGLEVDLKHGQFRVTDQRLGCEGEDLASSMVGLGVVVETASDEKVDLEGSGDQSWFRELEALATEVVIMPRRRDLFTPSRLGGSEILGPSKWDAVMFFIQASPVVNEYPPGARIFSAPKGECYKSKELDTYGKDRVWIQGTKWAVVVVYKDCHTVEQMDAKLLQHVRLGHVGDASLDKMVEQVIAPLKTNFMVTALDAVYVESPEVHEDAVGVGRGAYVPDGSDEILAVVKIQQITSVFWTSRRVYLEGKPSMYAVMGTVDYGRNDCYPLFMVVTVDSRTKGLEKAVICARALEAHTNPYCVVLLTNSSVLDLPSEKVNFPTKQMCFASPSKMEGDGGLPPGVTEPRTYIQAVLAVDSDEWMAAVKKEMVSVGNKQVYGEDYLDTFAPCTQLASVQLVIVLALNLGLAVYHMDVGTAFLNSELGEDLFVRLLRGCGTMATAMPG